MNSCQISIIVPVYNTKGYIEHTIKSFIGQTLQDWEAIIVDDGSTDGSSEICDEFARKDSRIKVIHQTNQGQNSARNKGLDAAVGKYIMFVDGDDVLTPYALKELFDLAEKNDADYTIGQIYPVDSIDRYSFDGLYNLSHPVDQRYQKVFSWQNCEDSIFWEIEWFMTVPCHIIKRELYEGIRFKETLNMGEDAITIKELLLKSKRIIVSPKYIYLYISRPSSWTHKRNNSAIHILDSYKNMLLLLDKYGLYEQKYSICTYYYFNWIWLHIFKHANLNSFPSFIKGFYKFIVEVDLEKLQMGELRRKIKKFRNPLVFFPYCLIKSLWWYLLFEANLIKSWEKFQKHFKNIITPFKLLFKVGNGVLKWLFEIIVSLYYLIIFIVKMILSPIKKVVGKR